MVAVPEPIPTPIDFDPNVIDIRDTKYGLDELIPAAGTPTFYADKGHPGWPGVFSWVRSMLTSDTREPVSLNMPNVVDALLKGLARLQEALSGFHNIGFAYTAQVAAHAHLALKYLQRLADVANYQLQSQIDAANWNRAVDVNAVRNDVAWQGAVLRGYVDDVARVLDGSMRNYVTQNAVIPLLENLGRLDHDLRVNTDQKVAGGVQLSGVIADAAIGAATASLPAIRAGLNALQKEADDCTKPMCDTLGPKTDLFKALKGLQALLGLLAGLSLAHLTEHDLERIARAFGAITTGSLDSFFGAFIEGGATVGDASGAVVGELTSAGTEALRTLGVPI